MADKITSQIGQEMHLHNPVPETRISATLIGRYKEQISTLWVSLLRKEWTLASDFRTALLEKDLANGQDIWSTIAKSLEGETEIGEKQRALFLEKVRTPAYSALDFFVEISLLERAVCEVVFNSSNIDKSQSLNLVMQVRREAHGLMEQILKSTSRIYEHIIELGGRGFCQMDTKGKIIFANQEAKRLIELKDFIGVSFNSFFEGREKSLVDEAMQNQKPLIRVLRFKSANALLPVSVEIGILLVDGVNCGSYAGLIDISRPIALQNNIFDRSPLGIFKVNLEEKFTYANHAALQLLGTDTLEGRVVRDIVPDDETYARAQARLKQRFQGVSEEYEGQFRRIDNGRIIPAVLAAVPETDLEGNIIGAVAIVRNVLRERIADEIHRHIATIRGCHKLLEAVAGEIKRVIPVDRLSVSIYSKDFKYVRTFFISESNAGTDTAVFFQRRWWEITESMRAWMRACGPGVVGDFKEIMSQKGFEHLEAQPAVQDLLNRGLRSMLSRIVVTEERVVASVTCFSKSKGIYDLDDLSMLRKLPLDQAVLMALYHEDRADLQFRLDLLKKVAAANNNIDAIAKDVVSDLAGHYEWSNVAILQVDEARGVFRMVSQPSHRIWKKAGMFCVALPHGRDEKTQQQHSSRRKAERAAANLQLHS